MDGSAHQGIPWIVQINILINAMLYARHSRTALAALTPLASPRGPVSLRTYLNDEALGRATGRLRAGGDDLLDSPLERLLVQAA